MVVSSPASLIEPAVATIVNVESEVIAPIVMSPVEAVRLTACVSSLPASAESTAVATMLPPATTVIDPSVVSKSVKVIPSVSSKAIAPAALVEISALVTVESIVIAPAASAVNTPPVTTVLASLSSTIAPAAFKVTAPLPALTVANPVMSPEEVVNEMLPFVPLATSVTVSAPPEVTVIVPSAVSTSLRVNAPRPSKSIAPVPVVDTFTEELAANSRSVSVPDPNTPISSCAVKVINPPAVKSTVLSSAPSLIEPAVAVSEIVPATLIPSTESTVPMIKSSAST